jgi:hypothetical protein
MNIRPEYSSERRSANSLGNGAPGRARTLTPGLEDRNPLITGLSRQWVDQVGQIRRRGNSHQIRWYRNGQRHEETVHSSRTPDAVDLLKIREADVAKGLPVTAKSVRFKFDDAAEDLMNEYTVNNRRAVDELERRIDKHLTPYFTGRKMSSITAIDIRAYPV